MTGSAEKDNAELILSDLALYKLYDVLNREGIEDNDIRYCKSIQYRFTGYDGLYDLCKMFEKNLRELPQNMNAVADNNEQCRYLIFWLNDQMRKKFNVDNVPTIDKNRIMQGFYSVSSKIKGELLTNKCEYIYNHEIGLELWKNWKDLYDYIRNKDNIREKIQSDKRLCKTYQDYYTHITSIYENYKKECCDTNNGRCPHYLNFKKWCNEGHIMDKLQCEISEEVPEPSEKNSLDMASTLNGEYEEVAEREAREGGVERAEFAAQRGESHVTLLDPPNDIGHSDSEAKEETTKGNETNPVGTIVGTSLGFVLPLITIYRFTPLGSWINTKIFRKDRLMENMKRNERELLLNSSGIGEMNFDNARYQIMYNSAHNE